MKNTVVILFFVLLLAPTICSGQPAKQPLPKISFDFVDADVKNVLRVFAEVAKKNIVIAEDVKGKVTIKLEDVAYDDAFDVILRNNDLAKIEEENIVRIMTTKKLQDERERSTKERLEFLKEKETKQKLEEEFVTETVFVNYADVVEVEKMIRGETSAAAAGPEATLAGRPAVAAEKPRGLLSPNGVVTLVRWNSALIIRDSKESVERVVRLIREQDVPPQQVQIEARIVQANSDFSKDLGVQWAASYKTTIGGTPAAISGDVNAGLLAGTGTLGILIGSAADSFKLDLTLSALERQGKGKIISNPKVITSDNRPARITQGQQIPYLNTTSQNGATVEFKDAVLELEVTPHVAKDGNISMKIKAKKDSVNLVLFPTNPPIDKREAVAELLVKDGETAVIGGIYESTQNSANSGVPFLQRIPLLGWLFKRNTNDDSRTELLIFVTPTILKNLYTEKRDR
jgi:type IV pilus assembly protein PilQ